MWLNGEEVEINKRGQAVLREIRAIAGDRVDPKTGEVIINIYNGLRNYNISDFMI